MRIATVMLLSSISLSAWANPPRCGDTGPNHANLLTPEQWQAIVDEKAAGDPVLEEAISIEQAKDRDSSQRAARPRSITWDQARKLILLGAVRRTFWHLDLTMALVTVTGRLYTSREPKKGDMQRAIEVVDPCGVYILRVEE